jgi:hypothetical protein
MEVTAGHASKGYYEVQKMTLSQFARALRRGVSADGIFTRRANTIDKGPVS